MTEIPSAARASRAIGAMFFTFFGAAWLVWWCVERYDGAPVVLAAIAIGAIGIFLLARRQLRINGPALAAAKDTPATKRSQRIFNLVNGAQWIAVTVAALVLANTGHPEWIRVAIIFIVGVHFLPLAAVFHYRWHYVTGGALIALALAYPLLTPAGPMNPAGLLGTGLILGASALVAVLPGQPSNSA